MRFYDITVPIRPDMPVFPNNPSPSIERTRLISAGANANMSVITLGSHTGTHVDAPCHFEESGGTVDQIPLDVLMGRVRVVEIMTEGNITAADLEHASLPHGLRRVLFKTRNSEFWDSNEFRFDYCGLAPDASLWLVERGLRLVGVDCLSVEPSGPKDYSTHHSLLGRGIAVIEGVDLRKVPPGDYTLVCLPLPIKGGDGSPARAVLIEPPVAGL